MSVFERHNLTQVGSVGHAQRELIRASNVAREVASHARALRLRSQVRHAPCCRAGTRPRVALTPHVARVQALRAHEDALRQVQRDLDGRERQLRSFIDMMRLHLGSDVEVPPKPGSGTPRIMAPRSRTSPRAARRRGPRAKAAKPGRRAASPASPGSAPAPAAAVAATARRGQEREAPPPGPEYQRHLEEIGLTLATQSRGRAGAPDRDGPEHKARAMLDLPEPPRVPLSPLLPRRGRAQAFLRLSPTHGTVARAPAPAEGELGDLTPTARRAATARSLSPSSAQRVGAFRPGDAEEASTATRSASPKAARRPRSAPRAPHQPAFFSSLLRLPSPPPQSPSPPRAKQATSDDEATAEGAARARAAMTARKRAGRRASLVRQASSSGLVSSPSSARSALSTRSSHSGAAVHRRSVVAAGGVSARISALLAASAPAGRQQQRRQQQQQQDASVPRSHYEQQEQQRRQRRQRQLQQRQQEEGGGRAMLQALQASGRVRAQPLPAATALVAKAVSALASAGWRGGAQEEQAGRSAALDSLRSAARAVGTKDRDGGKGESSSGGQQRKAPPRDHSLPALPATPPPTAAIVAVDCEGAEKDAPAATARAAAPQGRAAAGARRGSDGGVATHGGSPLPTPEAPTSALGPAPSQGAQGPEEEPRSNGAHSAPSLDRALRHAWTTRSRARRALMRTRAAPAAAVQLPSDSLSRGGEREGTGPAAAAGPASPLRASSGRNGRRPALSYRRRRPQPAPTRPLRDGVVAAVSPVSSSRRGLQAPEEEAGRGAWAVDGGGEASEAMEYPPDA